MKNFYKGKNVIIVFEKKKRLRKNRCSARIKKPYDH